MCVSQPDYNTRGLIRLQDLPASALILAILNTLIYKVLVFQIDN